MVELTGWFKLYALVGTVTLLGVAGVVAALVSVDTSMGQPWVVAVLTMAAIVGNVRPFMVVRKGGGFELSLEEAVFAVAFLLLPGGGVFAVAALSTVCVHAWRRRSAIKTVYNHAVQALAVSLGLLVRNAIVEPGTGAITTPELLAAAASVLAFSAVTTVLTWTVVATATGQRVRDIAGPGLGFDVVSCLMAVSWGLVAGTVARSSTLALGLCIVPVVMLRQLQYAEREREHLDILMATAISSASAVRKGAVEQVVLDATRESLRAGSAMIRPDPPSGEQIGARVASHGGDRWLVVGDRFPRDPFRPRDQVLLDGLAAIGAIAMENALLVDHVGRDPVTKLPTDALFSERVTAALGAVEQRGLTAVLVVKVGRLEVVKQTYGPASANVVLAEIASRLVDSYEAASYVSSPGYLGDGEFALAIGEVENRDEAMRVARLVGGLLRRPVDLDGVQLTMAVSIGVALGVTGAEVSAGKLGNLIRDALATASRIARVGGDRIELADASHADAATRRLALEGELRHALTAGHLIVHFQPVMEVASGRLVGAEALVRWEHPERGTISPAEFVPLAEETGLIVSLDRFVLTDACHQLARWSAEGRIGGSFTVAVNLSARQLAETDLVDFVAGLLAESGVEPERLSLELTESGVMHDAAVVAATLRSLRRLGVELAIDDFGTGYSSLLYLRDFPVDSLKIDRSFVAGMTERPGDAAIVAATVRLGHALGLRVVAEGVESADQLVQLRILGCDTAQGYLWSPAVTAEDLAADWLHRYPTGSRNDAPPRQPPVQSRTHDGTDERYDHVLSYLAHELRSPLTAVTGYAHLLDAHIDTDDTDAKSFLEAISQNAWELSDLLNNLDDVRALALGTLRLKTEPVDLRDVLETVLESMRPQLDPRPVALAVPRDVATVVADDARLRQILRNLLSNAGKFSPPESAVDISVEHDGHHVRIAVRDHGDGIAKDRRDELFRRFSRLGSSAKGMGIGLHLSKALARAHGGDLVYEPAAGGGSIFALELPNADPERRDHIGARCVPELTVASAERS